jgi:hypothetical protein
MELGINIDTPESDYFAFDACSNSRLTDMMDSPAECRFNIDNPSKPTAAMVLGSAVDTLVFTPKEFNKRFMVFGPCQQATAKGAPCSNSANKVLEDGRQVCGIHGKGMEDSNTLSALSYDDSELALAMYQAVFQHSTANQILNECESFQASLLWDFNGMPCKARLDGAAWSLDGGTIVDLKKTSPRGMFDAKEAFSRTLYNYGYFRQGAFYRWGAQQCGKPVSNVVFIVVDESKVKARLKTNATDKKLNECVNVYRLRDESLYYGEMQLQPLLAEYHGCWESGEWPYSEELIDVSIPIFAERLIERSIA